MYDYKKIDSFEAACADQHLDPLAVLPDVSNMPETLVGLGKSSVAFVKLCIISDSINKDDDGKLTKANWYDTDERKWSNWMDVEASEECPSGLWVSLHATGNAYSHATVPARLTCRDRERSIFFFKQHKALWEEYILHR